jgi:ATP/ADP translocase/HEAT repeat protein
MKNKVCRLFNLYPGEGKNTLLFALLALCWSLGINLGFKYSDALLLIHVGAQALPTVYIFSACGMIIPAILLMKAVNRIPSYRIFLCVIAIVIGFYAFIFSCLYLGIESGWLWYVLKIVSFQLDALLITSYWTFIDQYHNMQDAKRMYVLFSLTVFCGQAMTGFIMQLGLIPVKNIFLLIIVCMLLAAFLVRVIHKKLHHSHDQSVSEDEQQASSPATLGKIVSSLFKSRFTVLLMMNNFVIFFMWVTAEYNYFSFFDHYFDPAGTIIPEGGVKDAAITLFLGKILATVSVTNLVIGVFMYSRLVRRFGVTSLLFFSPVVMMIAMGGWTLHPAIIFPIMAYFIVEGFLEVIDDSNFNLLLNAIPKKLKYRARVLIESFLEPLAMLCAGVFLSIQSINPIYLCLLISLCAIYIAYLIKRNYHSSVYQNLSTNAIHFERSITEWLTLPSPTEQEKQTVQLFAILSSKGSDSEKVFAIHGLLALKNTEILNKLLTLLKKADPSLQTTLLDILIKSPFAKKRSVAEQLSNWLPNITNEVVESRIYYCLSQAGLLHPENVFEDIDSKNLLRKASAIITLKQSTHILPINISSQNRKIADEALRMLLESNQEDDVCMGLHILSTESTPFNHKLLLSYINHPSKRIQCRAMEAFSIIATSQCRHIAKTLISYLRSSQDSNFRKSCLRAIGKLDDPTLIRDLIASSLHFKQSERRLIESIIKKMGLSSVPMLLTATKDTALPDRCRALAARILGHLALHHLHVNLHDIMKVEIERAYFYYYHYHCIQGNYPNKDLSLLVEALQTGYHSVIEFIVQLLNSAGEVEDCDLISRLFRIQDLKLRSQVVETLEKTCDPTIFKSLRPLIENIPPSEVLRKYVEGRKRVMDLPELLKKLSRSSSPVNRIVSVTLMKEFDEPEWKDVLLSLFSSHEEIFRHFARELIDS